MADYLVHKAVERTALSTKAAAALQANDVWFVTPKYDGCHAIFTFEDGVFMGAYSRTGEPVVSMPHIATSLLDTYSLTQGRIAICGEAWAVGKEFNEISGMFRRHSPQKELGFVPFDIVPFDWVEGKVMRVPVLGQMGGRTYPAPYHKRFTSLLNFNPRAWTGLVIKPRHYEFVGSLDMAWDFASVIAQEHKRRTDSFYDGAILANAYGKYLVGSGKGGEFLKVKPLISYTVKVTAVISDIGGKTGKNTCVLEYQLDDVFQKVSTGLTQEQADAYTNDPSLIVNQYIEVEAMGLTVNGLLREPRFKGIRTDV